MAEIAGGDAVAEFQGRDADQKVREWKAHAFGLILTVDLPNAKSDHRRDRMNWQGRKQFVDKLVPLFLSLRCVGTGRTVGQFDQCDDGYVLIFFIWCFEHVDNLGAYSIPSVNCEDRDCGSGPPVAQVLGGPHPKALPSLLSLSLDFH